MTFTRNGIDYEEIGILYQCKVIGGKPDNGTIVIPYKVNGLTVTQIASHAFGGMTSLVDVQIPDCIEVIGQQAFANCQNLKNVVLYKTDYTSKKIEINRNAFAECVQLESFTCAAPLFLYEYVFFKCKKLSRINAVVSYCSHSTFEKCGLLSMIAFDDYAQWVGSSFKDCSCLRTLVFNGRIGKSTLRTESSMNAVMDKTIVCHANFPHFELAYEGYKIKVV
jgi:hypothetical protein